MRPFLYWNHVAAGAFGVAECYYCPLHGCVFVGFCGHSNRKQSGAEHEKLQVPIVLNVVSFSCQCGVRYVNAVWRSVCSEAHTPLGCLVVCSFQWLGDLIVQLVVAPELGRCVPIFQAARYPGLCVRLLLTEHSLTLMENVLLVGNNLRGYALRDIFRTL